nr:DUF917 family protein [Streptomyces sp. LBL]
MRELNVADIADLARGAAILGSGGGGNPYMGELIAKRAIAENGPVAVVDVAEVPADAIVVPDRHRAGAQAPQYLLRRTELQHWLPRRRRLDTVREQPARVHPALAEFLYEGIGAQSHGEDQEVGDEGGALGGLEGIDAPRWGEPSASHAVSAGEADAGPRRQAGASQQRRVRGLETLARLFLAPSVPRR